MRGKRGPFPILLGILLCAAPALAQDRVEPVPSVSPMSEAEMASRMAAREAQLEAAERSGSEDARAIFEQRLDFARNLIDSGLIAAARRQLDAVRAAAPDNADGRGRRARADLAELDIARRAGEQPADIPAVIARIAAPCSDGESQAQDALRLGQGLDGLATLWRDLAESERLALLDAAALCLRVTGDGFAWMINRRDLARLRLAADRPDEDYRAMLHGLESLASFLSRSDDYGYASEVGLRAPATDNEPVGLLLDTYWRLRSGARPEAASGRRLSLFGFTSSFENPVFAAAQLYDVPASAALRRRAARMAALYRRNDRAVALIDEQGDLIAAHRLDALRRIARVQALGYDASIVTAFSSFAPERAQGITRELGDAALPMQDRNYGLLSLPDVMRPGEAILLVVPTKRATHMFLLRPFGESLWARSSLTDGEIGHLAREIRFYMGVDVQPTAEEFGRWSEENVAHGAQYRLYRELVAPFAAEIAALDHLVVIAPGPLEGVPFSLLLTEELNGNSFDPAVLRGARWLADVVPMSRMPTLQAFALMRIEDRDRRMVGAPGQNDRRQRDRRQRGFLGVADPLLAGPEAPCGVAALRAGALTRAMPRDFAAAQSLADSLRSLPRLPCTAPEAMAVARAAAGRRVLLTGQDSAESRFHSASPSEAAVLLFATHAIMPGELPGVLEPSLVMTPPAVGPRDGEGMATPNFGAAGAFVDDGLISATEITRLGLSPEWLILSACNTGSGMAGLGHHSSGGIVPYFFAAGAARILATNWPLLDASAADITVRAIRNAANGRMSGAQALQQAMIAVRNDRSHDAAAGESLAHPVVWAAFELHGDGGPASSAR